MGHALYGNHQQGLYNEGNVIQFGQPQSVIATAQTHTTVPDYGERLPQHQVPNLDQYYLNQYAGHYQSHAIPQHVQVNTYNVPPNLGIGNPNYGPPPIDIHATAHAPTTPQPYLDLPNPAVVGNGYSTLQHQPNYDVVNVEHKALLQNTVNNLQNPVNNLQNPVNHVQYHEQVPNVVPLEPRGFAPQYVNNHQEILNTQHVNQQNGYNQHHVFVSSTEPSVQDNIAYVSTPSPLQHNFGYASPVEPVQQYVTPTAPTVQHNIQYVTPIQPAVHQNPFIPPQNSLNNVAYVTSTEPSVQRNIAYVPSTEPTVAYVSTTPAPVANQQNYQGYPDVQIIPNGEKVQEQVQLQPPQPVNDNSNSILKNLVQYIKTYMPDQYKQKFESMLKPYIDTPIGKLVPVFKETVSSTTPVPVAAVTNLYSKVQLNEQVKPTVVPVVQNAGGLYPNNPYLNGEIKPAVGDYNQQVVQSPPAVPNYNQEAISNYNRQIAFLNDQVSEPKQPVVQSYNNLGAQIQHKLGQEFSNSDQIQAQQIPVGGQNYNNYQTQQNGYVNNEPNYQNGNAAGYANSEQQPQIQDRYDSVTPQVGVKLEQDFRGDPENYDHNDNARKIYYELDPAAYQTNFDHLMQRDTNTQQQGSEGTILKVSNENGHNLNTPNFYQPVDPNMYNNKFIPNQFFNDQTGGATNNDFIWNAGDYTAPRDPEILVRQLNQTCASFRFNETNEYEERDQDPHIWNSGDYTALRAEEQLIRSVNVTCDNFTNDYMSNFTSGFSLWHYCSQCLNTDAQDVNIVEKKIIIDENGNPREFIYSRTQQEQIYNSEANPDGQGAQQQIYNSEGQGDYTYADPRSNGEIAGIVKVINPDYKTPDAYPDKPERQLNANLAALLNKFNSELSRRGEPIYVPNFDGEFNGEDYGYLRNRNGLSKRNSQSADEKLIVVVKKPETST